MKPRLVGNKEVTELGMTQRSQGRMVQRRQCRMDLRMRGAEVGLIRARAESRTADRRYKKRTYLNLVHEKVTRILL